MIEHRHHPNALLTRIRLRAQTRRIARGQQRWSVGVDSPAWSEHRELADFARVLGLTSKWEAVGSDYPTMIADLHRLGRDRGFGVMAFGSAFTVSFDDGSTHVLTGGFG